MHPGPPRPPLRRLDFLWKPWGSIELWEAPVTTPLRSAGVATCLVSDHPHLFETGGENYHVDFRAWDYQRGHESDPWRTAPDPSWLGAPTFGRPHMPYDDSRGWFRGEDDFPGPPHHGLRGALAAGRGTATRPLPPGDRRVRPARTVRHPRAVGLAVRLRLGRRTRRTPPGLAPLRGRRRRRWSHHRAAGPPAPRPVRRQAVDDRPLVRCGPGRHRPRPVGTTTPPSSCAPTTATTSVRRTSGASPAPGCARRSATSRCWWRGPARRPSTNDALTTTVDLHATICDVFDVSPSHRTHGNRWSRSIGRRARSGTTWSGGRLGPRGPPGHRPMALRPCPCWRQRAAVHVVQPVVHHAGARRPGRRHLRLPLPDDRAALDRMPDSTVPVIRQPFQDGDLLPFWAWGGFTGDHLFDDQSTPARTRTAATRELQKKPPTTSATPSKASTPPTTSSSAWACCSGNGGGTAVEHRRPLRTSSRGEDSRRPRTRQANGIHPLSRPHDDGRDQRFLPFGTASFFRLHQLFKTADPRRGGGAAPLDHPYERLAIRESDRHRLQYRRDGAVPFSRRAGALRRALGAAPGATGAECHRGTPQFEEDGLVDQRNSSPGRKRTTRAIRRAPCRWASRFCAWIRLSCRREKRLRRSARTCRAHPRRDREGARAGNREHSQRIWTRHRSTRYLWSEMDVGAAVDHVLKPAVHPPVWGRRTLLTNAPALSRSRLRSVDRELPEQVVVFDEEGFALLRGHPRDVARPSK